MQAVESKVKLCLFPSLDMRKTPCGLIMRLIHMFNGSFIMMMIMMMMIVIKVMVIVVSIWIMRISVSPGWHTDTGLVIVGSQPITGRYEDCEIAPMSRDRIKIILWETLQSHLMMRATWWSIIRVWVRAAPWTSGFAPVLVIHPPPRPSDPLFMHSRIAQ